MAGMDWGTLLGNLLPALVVNVILGGAALRSGSVRRSGFWGGLLVGVPIYLCLGWRGFLVLVGMFAVGTILTRMGYARKELMGVAEEAKGARGASHALANAGVACVAAVLYWMTLEPLLTVFFTAAFATASMDTAGSEIGPLYGRRTISLLNLRPVAPGTEGAVSLEGTLAGVAAAAVVGGVGAAAGLHGFQSLVPIVLGALLGNLYEGVLGSRHLLPHAWLNATNTLVGGGCAVLLARVILG